MIDSTSSHESPTKTDLSGFVAMEYYALILNRTFVVFIAPDRLYGWRASGPVGPRAPLYFDFYAKMLDDPELMKDMAAVQELAKLKGGFVIPRPEICSVEVIPKQKPGMGGIPHSGRILIHLVSGGKREFILLGMVDAERIRQLILS